MEYRASKSGIAADIQRKRQEEYKVTDEIDVITWIECVLMEHKIEEINFHEWLQDGSVLCRIFSAIQPGKIAPKHLIQVTLTTPFKQLDNINMYLNAVRKYGIREEDMFVSLDLYEANDLTQVISNIYALDRIAHLNGWNGPHLSPIRLEIKTQKSEKNSENKSEEGKEIIPMQMGTNTFASQAGMPAPGTRRQIL